MNYSYWLIVFLLLSNNIWGQSTKFKFGKPSKEILTAQTYAADPEAELAYLHRSCRTEIVINRDSKGNPILGAEISVNYRIKVYKTESDILSLDSIELWVPNQHNIDRLSKFSVVTCNLKNQTIEKTTLSRSDIQETRTNSYWKQLDFSASDVRDGSVIDVRYVVFTPRVFNLADWSMQTSIPVAFSEYELAYPDFLDYKVSPRGYITLQQNETTAPKTFFQNSSQMFNEITKTYSAIEIPAFVEEPFISSKSNYISHITADLVSHNISSAVRLNQQFSWEQVNSWLLAHENIGQRLKQDKFLTPIIQDLVSGIEDPVKKIMTITKFIRKQVKWTGTYSLYSYSLKEIYERKKANSAGMNLLLIQALRIAGINAAPIALRTRYKGILNITKPSYRSFNHIITGIILADGTIKTLDATYYFSGFDLLPENCLNQQGLMIGDKPQWIPLDQPSKTITSYVAKLTLDNEQTISGSLDYTMKGNAAVVWRNKRAKEGSNKKLLRDLDWDNDRFKITGGTTKGYEDLNNSLKLKAKIELRRSVETDQTTLSIQPIFIGQVNKNPFEAEKRNYPIEWSFPEKNSFVMSLTIPETYQVRSLPKAALVKLPNGGGTFSYNAVQMGQTIQIIANYSVNQTFFLQEDYPLLQQYFDKIIEKQQEQIILEQLP